MLILELVPTSGHGRPIAFRVIVMMTMKFGTGSKGGCYNESSAPGPRGRSIPDIRGVASRSGGRHDYVPGRMPTWWTQVLAVGLASRRASSIGWRHTSQTPYFPATKRSIAASTSRKWSRD